MKTCYVPMTCEFMLHEDDWNEGEGDLISRWDEADHMKSADTIEGVLEQVNYLNCDAFGQKPINEVFENDPCHDKEYGRFDASLTVDFDGENIIKPTAEKCKQFEAGEIKLYTLHIFVRIMKMHGLEAVDVAAWRKD